MSSPLTVVQLVPQMKPGGVERGTVETAAELIARGHRSVVIAADGPLAAELVAGGSEHLDWPIGAKSVRTLRLARRLAKFCRMNRVDVLHARSRVPAWVGLLAQRSVPASLRPRLLTTVHGLYSVNRYSSVMVRGDAVAVISETAARYVRQNYAGLAPDHLELAYRGVDPAEFPRGYQPPGEWRREFAAEFPQLQGRPLITLPGRVTRLKGHHDFLDVIDRLRQRRPEVAGVIVGGEDPRKARYAAELRAAVTKRDLRNNIVFAGHRSDMRDWLAASDVVVSCTADPPEAFGRTVLESLSLGTPVVGYDGSGPAEILAAMCPAGCVPAGDPSAMASRVGRFLDAPPVITPNTKFTRREMLDAEAGLYERLAADRHAGRRFAAGQAIHPRRRAA